MAKKLCYPWHEDIPYQGLACDFLTFLTEDVKQEVIKEALKNEKEEN